MGLIREKVIDAILATDMAKHGEFIDRFSARVSKQKDNPFATDTKDDRERQKASKADRRMLLQAFSHMADLGHTCRPWHIHKNLVVLLEEEFFAQGDRERQQGIPVMPLIDRTKDSAAVSQGFFLDKLVRPMLEPYTHFLNSELGGFMLSNLSKNRDRWMELVKQHGKQTAAQIVPLDKLDSEEEKCK